MSNDFIDLLTKFKALYDLFFTSAKKELLFYLLLSGTSSNYEFFVGLFKIHLFKIIIKCLQAKTIILIKFKLKELLKQTPIKF